MYVEVNTVFDAFSGVMLSDCYVMHFNITPVTVDVFESFNF